MFKLGTAEEIEAFLKILLVGIEDIVDEDGEPIPYCDALCDQVVSSIPARFSLRQICNSAFANGRAGNRVFGEDEDGPGSAQWDKDYWAHWPTIKDAPQTV